MSSGFVSEAELEEQKRKRQEEWEKVRKPDQPEEAPDEPYDHRSLFDRLEEQKQKKQIEYEEAHKLKNMIKGLDDDEVEFLDFVDRKKMEAEHLKEQEEKQELMEFRKNVEQLRESFLEERIQAEIRSSKPNLNNSNGVKSQQKLLKGVVVKRKALDMQNDGPENKKERNAAQGSSTKEHSEKNIMSPQNGKRKREAEEEKLNEDPPPAHTCIGILPGLGNYGPSSDSESDSSLSDVPDHAAPKYDLLGRRLVLMTQEKKNTGGGH